MGTNDPKTNAVRLLESLSVEFDLHAYDASDGRIDAAAVAEKVGVAPERLFKTLVARTASDEIVVFCVPGSTELDLKKAARAAGAKSVQLVRASELKGLTGYERGGCSPFGMKRPYPIRLEESALRFDRILVSGGAIGLQIEISPADLCRLTKAEMVELV
ncbi:MAG TPA: Cys-tRNA(Pro) deacylase [Spirochaetia bacterium]|nr:Cys-tRNA(Pro) deacylase [Spirochaetia bacterium]